MILKSNNNLFWKTEENEEWKELKELDSIGSVTNLELLDVVWFNKLGIVKTRDKISNEIKFYIGEGLGFNEEIDIQHIMDMGTKYTPESFRELIKWLEVDNAQNT